MSVLACRPHPKSCPSVASPPLSIYLNHALGTRTCTPIDKRPLTPTPIHAGNDNLSFFPDLLYMSYARTEISPEKKGKKIIQDNTNDKGHTHIHTILTSHINATLPGKTTLPIRANSDKLHHWQIQGNKR